MIITTPRRLLTLCLACACLLTTSAPAQTLARPGWVGSGINTDVWWKHAIVYQVNPLNFNPPTDKDTPSSSLHGVAQRLDYIHSLGADALLLTAIQPDAAHAQSIDPAYGTLDDLDDLIHEASRHNNRILLDLDPNIPAGDLPNVARFWLNRGIAGFHVIGATPEAHAQAAELRKATSTYLGQRILIGDVDPTLSSSPHQRTYKAPDPQTTQLLPQLLLDTRLGAVTPLNAAAIRSAVESTENIAQAGHSLPLLASDGPSFQRSMSRYADGKNDLAIAKLLATILFTTRAQPLLYYGQELGVLAPAISGATPPKTPTDAPKETSAAPADKPTDTSVSPPETPKDTPALPADAPKETSAAPADKPTDTSIPAAETPKDTPATPAAAPTDTPKPTPATPIIIWDAPPPPPKGKPEPEPEPATPNPTPNAVLEDANPASLLNWYRRLIELHHSNATINSGEYLTINRDEQNVLIMIRKPKDVSATNPILIILCNLSGEPAHLSIKKDTMKLHLRGSFLRTVLRSDNGMGTMHLESMTLPPYTAYIGALRF
ncbi:MAG TPA: alpha-amylase family glycosyl hydrolase [Edaphobacter sp.]|nr:alpha-amylase family glycosyl hydrolase [Edaphobacter sp.]